MPETSHIETVHTTFLGRPLTIRMHLYDDKCAGCGTDMLLPVLPDGLSFCEQCTYERFVASVFDINEEANATNE